MSRWNLPAICILLCAATSGLAASEFSGHVRDESGAALGGVFVSARHAHVAFTVTTQTDGTFHVGPLGGDGPWTLEAYRIGYHRETMADLPGAVRSGIDFVLRRKDDLRDDAPGFAFVGAFPEGARKRRLIVDCMGCHPMNQSVIYKEGRLLDALSHMAAAEKMLGMAGANSMFPVISPERKYGDTTQFLAKYLNEAVLSARIEKTRGATTPAGGLPGTLMASG